MANEKPPRKLGAKTLLLHFVATGIFPENVLRAACADCRNDTDVMDVMRRLTDEAWAQHHRRTIEEIFLARLRTLRDDEE